MRYRFRGLRRDAGTPVEGHVEAPSEDVAYAVLSDNGIVTEGLRPDPPAAAPGAGPPGPSPAGQSLSGQTMLGGSPQDIAQALESAFDTATRQVNVDALAQRFRGQRVRVIDRDKIRLQIMQIIDNVIQQANAHEDTHEQIRDRIAEAVNKMFEDNRNLTSQAQQQGNEALERQIARLSRVVQGMERAVANMATVLRTGGGGGGGGTPRFSHQQRERDEAQSAVLLEIFETNLTLQRELEDNPGGTPAASPAASASASADHNAGSATPGSDGASDQGTDDAAKPLPAS